MNKLKLRILLSTVLCLAGIFVALAGAGLYSAPSKAPAEAVPGSAAPTANAPGGAGRGASGRPGRLEH